MTEIFYAFLMVSLFCTSAHFMVKSLTASIGVSQLTVYSKKALLFEKFYKSTAWAVSTMILFYFTLVNFLSIFLGQ